ncbi:MAG TPA: hypothetical protein VE482_10010 [Candidatus Eisenbacteria bacterium]|nr:hypothetical protein [Candidatus Eisenbacteria bacterium]
MSTTRTRPIKVADEVWVATALLHREHPEREGFTPDEIMRRVEREAIHGRLRPGIHQHAIQHNVANRPPNPGRYRMLYASGKMRRLFRAGDDYHPDRAGSKTTPTREQLPAEYHYLLDWYASEYVSGRVAEDRPDPILNLRGLGREIWKGEDADRYVRRLRERWE